MQGTWYVPARGDFLTPPLVSGGRSRMRLRLAVFSEEAARQVAVLIHESADARRWSPLTILGSFESGTESFLLVDGLSNCFVRLLVMGDPGPAVVRLSCRLSRGPSRLEIQSRRTVVRPIVQDMNANARKRGEAADLLDPGAVGGLPVETRRAEDLLPRSGRSAGPFDGLNPWPTASWNWTAQGWGGVTTGSGALR